ncbi:MAG: UDP-glucose/GDP-mannose dehydrogenase family protein [Bacteroidota bacterium]|nr:UDP-glucose/GDP-mannose dehydrogenase family protein [Bacteroidota bacterium]
MKISVVGSGYVGLVAGTCFAESGNDVICVDNDINKIKTMKKGKTPIYEPGLEEFLKKNIHEKRLKFSTDLESAVKKTDIIFLALPTPQSEDGSADLKHVLAVAKEIGKYMNDYKVIVNKSTVPVGTAFKVRDIIRKETEHPFDVVSNPEFLKEGAAINDFFKPDRVVIGTLSEKARKIMGDLYAPFVRTGKPIIFMDELSSELTKYAANALLATKVTFMNEIANICERVGADVKNVRLGVGSDERIGYQFLFPGVGYGGSCFPKDIAALVKTSSDYGYRFQILKSVEGVNREQKKLIVKKLLKYFNNNIKGKTIAVWGLSFKPNTDDMREAPSITIINELLKRGVKVQAHDPVALHEAKRIFGNKIKYFENNYDALKNAEALVIVTEWNEFRRPDFDKMKKLMKHNAIFDGRNIYDPEAMVETGFAYYSIGRRVINGR